MGFFPAMYICLYFALLFAYFFSETSGNFRRRAVNKIALSSMFLFWGAAAWLLRPPLAAEGAVLLLGLFLSFCGDVLLLWSFVRGGLCFGMGNLVLLGYEVLLIRRLGIPLLHLWPAALILLVFWCPVLAFSQTGALRLEKFRVAFPIYLLSVSLHGSLGLVLVFLHPVLGMLLLGGGLFLFMVSDYFLTVFKFRYRARWVMRCNSGAYFTGMILVALSLSYPF